MNLTMDFFFKDIFIMLFQKMLERLVYFYLLNKSNFDEKVDLFSKQLCMHIAAADPISLEM